MTAIATKIFFWVAIIYIAFCIALFMTQRSFIYFPDAEFPMLPDSKEAGFIRVPTEDGLTLIGWYSPAKDGMKTIVYFHGNAGNIGSRLPLMRDYIRQGYGVIMAEYRGYGGNPGSPSEEGFYQDARAYLNFLTGQHVIDPSMLVLYGESIGSGVAVQMAKEYPDIAALILVTPFSKLLDIAQKTYFFVPVRFMLSDQFDNHSKISELKMPVYFFMAGKDEVIDPVSGNDLFDAAGASKKRFDFSEAGHNSIPVHELNAKVSEVLDALP